MKTILFVLLFAGLAGNYNKSFSWDTTAAKLYPMAIGNLWSYNYKVYSGPGGCNNITSEINYIVRIISDTLMPNGKRYFKFEDRTSFFYRRIDSVKMNVYQYQSGGECLYDSLKGTLNSSFTGCNTIVNIINVSTINIFGANRIRRDSRPVPCPGCGRTLVEGLGFYEDYICLTSGNRTLLNGCIINGIQYGQIVLGINQISTQVPSEFSLSQNYPNPFNPTTNIKFQIPNSEFVKLTVYDVLGREVQMLVNEEFSPGTYETDFDASLLPSGVYYYQLEAGSFSQTKKMVLIK